MREASGTRPSACESIFACDSLDALSRANVESPAVWIPVGKSRRLPSGRLYRGTRCTLT